VAGKGKVSNDLVAVGCAAVLTVYAAGYWRTRDAARRIETQVQERRAVAPERPADSAPQPPAIEAAAPEEQLPEPPAAVAAPSVAASVPKEAAGTLPPAANVAAAPVVAVAVAEAQAQAEAEDSSAVEAVAPDAPVVEALVAPVANWQDGTYTGWGSSRHGDIKAQVVIRGGRIVESSIVSCETRWPCDVISEIINQPVQRQSPDVDSVSRATVSADAYYFALVTALEHARREPPAAAASEP
jgi:uncharacterized protein with FMN-binding domain